MTRERRNDAGAKVVDGLCPRVQELEGPLKLCWWREFPCHVCIILPRRVPTRLRKARSGAVSRAGGGRRADAER